MPNFISIDGKWEPAKEEVSLTKPDGRPFIYNGPDRAALEYMKEQGVESLGIHYSKDPEIIMRARQLNMSVEEFTQTMNVDKAEKAKVDAAKKEAVVLHTPPKKVKAIDVKGGGMNTAGNSDHRVGGFGEPAEVPVKK